MTTVGRSWAGSRKLIAILRAPEYRRALRFGVAASVEHETIPLRSDFQTVIDAGANRGQFAVFAARRFPRATLLCFEPLPAPGARLRRALGTLDRLSLTEVALGTADAQAQFHVSKADDSSSLLAIGHRQSAAFPGTEQQMTTTVQVRRLDSALSTGDLIAPALLKIDVQGGELGVLQGAEAILPSIDAILVEVSFVELYAGQPLVDDVWDHLHSHGFSCRGVWSMTYGAQRECLQGDLLFARAGFDPLVA